MFPPNDEFSDALDEICKSKGINQFFKHELTAIDKENRRATFTDPNGDSIEKDFDFLHMTPAQTAPDFVAKSQLAHESGWLDVNIGTL